MRIMQRYRAFQQEGLNALASQSRVLETHSGKVEFAVQGDGHGILVAHGSLGGFDQALSSVYFLNMPHAQFIAPSRFGYLGTPLPTDATPKAQAHAYAALLDALAVEKVWLIGLSAGGMSALQFALEFPSRCRGLIMISAVSRRPTRVPPIRFLVEHVLTNDFLGWLLVTKWPQLVAQSTGDDYSLVATNPALQEVFLKLGWPPHASRRRAGMINDLIQADALPDLPYENIAAPTLIVHGTADPFVPFASAEYLAARITGARLLAFQKGGHLSFLTHQDITAGAIRSLMEAQPNSQW